jgi:hypothetical protein
MYSRSNKNLNCLIRLPTVRYKGRAISTLIVGVASPLENREACQGQSILITQNIDIFQPKMVLLGNAKHTGYLILFTHF